MQNNYGFSCNCSSGKLLLLNKRGLDYYFGQHIPVQLSPIRNKTILVVNGCQTDIIFHLWFHNFYPFVGRGVLNFLKLHVFYEKLHAVI